MSADNPYNLDMTSARVQPMCEKRAGEAILKETFLEYFGGLNYFIDSEQANLIYADVIEHIGVDPSEYRYDEAQKAQIYTWYAAEDEACVLNVWFKDGRLYACGAYNLGFPKMS